MRNVILGIQEVIDDEEDSEDVWVVYEQDHNLEEYQCLHQLLWNIEFNPKTSVKTYTVTHSTFYEILSNSHGKTILS